MAVPGSSPAHRPTVADVVRHHVTDPDDASVWVRSRSAPRPIHVVAYDPSWPADYSRVERRVRAVLGDRVLEIEHVGSTSVPGLAAKPVIDVDLTVTDSRAEQVYVPDLEAAGFQLVIREPGWHEHRALVVVDPGPGPEQLPRTNLHVWSPNCPEVVRHRLLRDWLVEHPEDRALYQAAKTASAQQANAAGEHVMDYNLRKEPVVRHVLDRVFRAHGLL